MDTKMNLTGVKDMTSYPQQSQKSKACDQTVSQYFISIQIVLICWSWNKQGLEVYLSSLDSAVAWFFFYILTWNVSSNLSVR